MADTLGDHAGKVVAESASRPRFWTLSGELLRHADLDTAVSIADAKRALGRAMGVGSGAVEVIFDAHSIAEDTCTLMDLRGQDLTALVFAQEPVWVVVRLRPLNGKEICHGCRRIVRMDTEQVAVVVDQEHGCTKLSKDFPVDAVFDQSSSQGDIFHQIAPEILNRVLEGYNATFVAYGQTGAGKTHTISGPGESPEDLRGLLPRAVEYIFGCLDGDLADMQCAVFISYMEVYNDKLHDLLSPERGAGQRLKLRDHPLDGVCVDGLTPMLVRTAEEALALWQMGSCNRTVAATMMGQCSTRGHAIFSLSVEQSSFDACGSHHIKVGKLLMVDLAGSERQPKPKLERPLKDLGRSLENARTSLADAALCNVINAVVHGASSHIPYRDSKLTRILQHSFGGNCKTVFIANVCPADYSYDETLATLRYACRARRVKNTTRINNRASALSENSPSLAPSASSRY